MSLTDLKQQQKTYVYVFNSFLRVRIDKDHEKFDLILTQNKTEYKVTVTVDKSDKFHIHIEGEGDLVISDTFNLNDEVLNVVINQNDGLTLQLISKEHNGSINLQYLGTKYHIQVHTKSAHDMLKYMPAKKHVDMSSKVLSPMPGIVKSIAVEVGQLVNEGSEICTVEAMKMQNKLVASKTGKVIFISIL